MGRSLAQLAVASAVMAACGPPPTTDPGPPDLACPLSRNERRVLGEELVRLHAEGVVVSVDNEADYQGAKNFLFQFSLGNKSSLVAAPLFDECDTARVAFDICDRCSSPGCEEPRWCMRIDCLGGGGLSGHMTVPDPLGPWPAAKFPEAEVRYVAQPRLDFTRTKTHPGLVWNWSSSDAFDVAFPDETVAMRSSVSGTAQEIDSVQQAFEVTARYPGLSSTGGDVVLRLFAGEGGSRQGAVELDGERIGSWPSSPGVAWLDQCVLPR